MSNEVILQKVTLLDEEVAGLADLSKENIEKITLRGHKLDELQLKSEDVLQKSEEYQRLSKKLRGQKRRQAFGGCLCWVLVIVVPLVLVLAMVVVVVILVKQKQA